MKRTADEQEAFLFHRLEFPKAKTQTNQPSAVARMKYEVMACDGYRIDREDLEDRQDGDDGDGGERDGDACPMAARGRAGILWQEAGLAEVTPGERVLHDAADHAYTRGGEAVVPVDAFAEIAADERAEESAEIHAHIEERETRVAACAAFRIELSDKRTGARLEQRSAEHDNEEADEEGGFRGNGEGEVPNRNDDPTDQDRALLADEAVGEPASRQRHQIHAADIEPVDRAGGLVRQTEPSFGDAFPSCRAREAPACRSSSSAPTSQ